MDLRLSLGLLDSVLPQTFERGHVGGGPLEGVFPAVYDAPYSEEGPRSRWGLATLVDMGVPEFPGAAERFAAGGV